MKSLVLAFAIGFSFAPFAAAMEHDKVTMEDQVKVGDKTLQLNGMGTRIAYVFGLPIKVYVAGLYVEKKTNNPTELIDGPQLRRLVLDFRRSVTREQSMDSWKEGFNVNCVVDCDASKAQFSKEFLAFLTSYRQGQKMTLTFYPDRVETFTDGEAPRTIKGLNFSKNLMAVFFGKKMPNKELVVGMLGKP